MTTTRSLLLLALLAGAWLGAPHPAPAAGKVDFARDVLPILSENCFACHGPDAKARKARLRLDTKDGALRKDDPIVVPGKSAASELVRRIKASEASEVMPPPRFKKKLTPQQVAVLERWVDEGAPWGKHWAFERPRRPAVPGPGGWARNPIDAFLLARLKKEGLRPAPEADRVTLIRRVTLDLTGLPPTPEEVDTFLTDTRPGAYERVVDRLLTSPRFGERMVWEWLEAARYADSNGYQGDGDRTMWPWRDWAVRAFNADLPFDQFTVEQIAGDLLPNATNEQKLATAFLRNHMINGEGGRIAEENRVDYIMDMVETTATVWLGLTMNCCRCHDHKYDPLLQREYYQLFAFFNQTPVNGGGGDPQTRPIVELLGRDDQARLDAARAKATAAARDLEALETKLFPREKGKSAADSPRAKGLPKTVLDALRPAPASRNRNQLGLLEKHFAKEAEHTGKLRALAQAVAARDEASRRIVRVMVMEDMPRPRDTFVLVKGLYNKPAAKVSAGTPAVLPPLPPGPANRLTLARWLVAPEHPLTARVVVNRYWQQLFGIGLVKTPEDFGVQGERPVHPELLDWLAVEFIESGWDLKHLLKLLVSSAAYRQSSAVTRALAERDPDNRLLARGPRHRLPSWVLRDQALAASGLLVGTVGGPSVRPYQPPGIWEEITFGNKRYVQDKGDALYRRSAYTFWRRIVGPTAFFDVAARQTCTVKQGRTNTPLHALVTLNDTTFVEVARVLAERVLTTGPASDEARVEQAFRLVVARRPSAEERPILIGALKRLRAQYAANPAAAKKLLAVGERKRNESLSVTEHAAFANLCQLILNLDEALTKE
jgi:hypothetical protein